MSRWQWPARWFLPLALLSVLLTSSQAAFIQVTHTTAADFGLGDGDDGFIITQHQDGELTLTPRALGITPWTELTSTPLPQTLHEHTVVAANGHLFVVGGKSSRGLEQAVYRAATHANGTLGPWQVMPPLLHPLYRHAAVKAGGGLLVIGGKRGEPLPEVLATVYRSTVAANGDLSGWVELTETPLPHALVDLGAVVVNGYLFIIGGEDSNGQRQPTVYRAPLNPNGALGAWTRTTSLPISLYNHAVATAGNCIFVAGGQSYSDIRTEVYSAAVGADGDITAWQALNNARLPQPLERHTATVAAGQLFIAGGLGRAPIKDRDKVYQAAINTDCTLEPWVELTGSALPRRMEEHAAATADSYLFVTGGCQIGNVDQYDTVYRAAVIPDRNLGGWQALSQTLLPQPLSAHAAALSGDYLFVTGGLGVYGIQSAVYRATASPEGRTGEWTEAAPLPQPLREHVTIAVDDRLLTIGGHNGSADQAAVYEAVVKANGSLTAWQPHPCTLPVALSGHAAMLTDDYIYLSGGRQGFEERDAVYRMKRDDDGSQGCWQPVASLSQPLAGHAMAATEDYLFVSGGVTGAGATATNTVYSATIQASGDSLSAWTELSDSPLPADLRDHVMVAANGYLYVVGGFTSFGSSAQYQIYRAKIKADGGLEAWEELVVTPLPHALYNHAAVTTDLHLLILGGYRNNQHRDTVYVTSLYKAAAQAAFTHRFDLGSDQDIGVLDWRARGDSDAVLSVHYRIAPDATARYGPWSEAYTTSPPLPIYDQGRYLQYQLLVENPNGGVKAIDEVSLTYGDVGDYVKVVDEGGAGIPNAEVYRNGQFVGTTNSQGILPPEILPTLQPGYDRLAVLSRVAQMGTIREAHTTPDSEGVNWAYRTYLTNLEITDASEVLPYTVTQPGGQVIRLGPDNPLVLYNLLVSIEWDATMTYTQQISQAVRYASDYLYDLTDGQMAFGQVDIYDEGAHWADADIQISTKNIVHPHAYIGGITSEDTSHVIRVGRGWDGNSGNQGAWDHLEGYRTLGHEFGHYGLYLYDEYFKYVFDENDNLIDEVKASCTGPENRNAAMDATNASMMDYQYTTSELAMRGVSGLWSSLCEATAQWQLNGESDWETLMRKYADTVSPSRWQFTTPADRGCVLAGPEGLPSDLLPFPQVTKHNGGPSAPPRQLTVYGPDGPYWGAIVALYKQNGRVIGQGFTDSNGCLDVYGADEGDIVRAASFDGGLAGSVTVTTEMTITLILEPVGGLMLQAEGLTTQVVDVPPHMRVMAWPSGNPDQIDLLILLQNFGPGADPSVVVTEPGNEAGHVPTLSYSPTTGTYEGQISFSATERGMGRIRAVGAVGNSLVRLQSTYRLQRVVNGESQEVYSDDGNLELHLEPGSLPGDEAYVIVMPPGAVPGPLPAGLVLVGDSYDVTASGALIELEKPAVLKLHYDGALINQSSVSEGLGIYRWEPNSEMWQAVPGSLDEEQRAVVASITTLGTYALMAPVGPWKEPNVILLPIIFKGAP